MMPERGFDTATWDSDRWFQGLSLTQRYLFIYLFTNHHCNPAGLYYLTLATIAFDTKITEDQLPELLHSLDAKVQWYEEQDLIWVKNFIKRQTKNPKFLIAVAKSLAALNANGIVKEVLEYNQTRHSISIPYQYTIHTLAIPSRARASDADTDTLSSPNAGTEKRGKPERGKTTGGEKVPSESVVPSTPARSVVKECESWMGRPITHQEVAVLMDLEGEFSPDWLAEAIKSAASSGGRTLKYVEVMLEGWRKDGRPGSAGAVRRRSRTESQEIGDAPEWMKRRLRADQGTGKSHNT